MLCAVLSCAIFFGLICIGYPILFVVGERITGDRRPLRDLLRDL